MTTTHHTNLYNTEYCKYSADSAVKKLLSMGCPASKIVIGVAYYSRGSSGTDGIGKPRSGLSTDMDWEQGICDYKTLPRPGSTEFYDVLAGANYSYDPQKRILNSYDGIQSVTEKCKYVVDNNLKGIIVWESSGDRPVSSGRSLTELIHRNLHSASKTTPPRVPLPPTPPVVTPVTPRPTPVVTPVTPRPTPVVTPVTPRPIQTWVPNRRYPVGSTVNYLNSSYDCSREHVSGVIKPVHVGYWKTRKQDEKCDYISGRVKSITIDIGDVNFN